MSIGNHVQRTEKYSCEIISCDPEQNIVQGVTRFAGIQITVLATPPAFRWPKVGENWMVKRENGTWYLEGILQDSEDSKLLAEMQPGDLLLNVPGTIFTNTGERVLTNHLDMSNSVKSAAEAKNLEIYVDSTSGVLSFKDGMGVSHALY